MRKEAAGIARSSRESNGQGGRSPNKVMLMMVSSQADTLRLIVLDQAEALKLVCSLAAALLDFGPPDDYVGGALESGGIAPYRRFGV